MAELSVDKSAENVGNEEAGKIITDEDDELIKIGFNTYKDYFMNYYGGWKFIILVNSAMVVFTGFRLCTDYITGKWADDPDQSGDKFAYYSILSFTFAVGQSIGVACRSGTLVYFNLGATKKLHGMMLRNIFEAPVNLYFDQTPIGRILNRFSKDLNVLDTQLPFQIGSCMAMNYLLIYTIVVAIIAVPYTAILLPVIFMWSACLIRRVSASIT